MKKVMLVFGTRPEAIKMCPLVKELKKRNRMETIVCVTGQHREMLNQVLELFQVIPDYNLDIMKQGQSLEDVTVEILLKMKEVLIQEKPDIVLVHGDTTTTFAVALACFYQRIQVGHVEAGLRTYHMDSPYPEEFNRQVVDILADLHFAPTKKAADYLLKEGKSEGTIYITGNTAIDALHTTISNQYHHEYLKWAEGARLILVTAHRRENLGEPMKHMFTAIRRIVDSFSDVKVLYPIHMNPLVREIANEVFHDCERIRLVEPMDVFEFHNIMNRSYLIMTDSGGIQEEAPSLGKPVLVMRDTTERTEGVEAGTLKLVGTEENSIFLHCKDLLENSESYHAMSIAVNPYGDGHASERIVDILEERFELSLG